MEESLPKRALAEQETIGQETIGQESITIQLLRTREALMAHFRPMLSARDLTEQQWRVLRSLDQCSGLEAGELAEMAAVLPPSLTRILKTLEQRGLVICERHRRDGRRLTISLSSAGQIFMRDSMCESQRIYLHLKDIIEADRLALLSSLLGEITERVQRAQDDQQDRGGAGFPAILPLG
jgi:homoprotocatechuate degradation regulator HpaR